MEDVPKAWVFSKTFGGFRHKKAQKLHFRYRKHLKSSQSDEIKSCRSAPARHVANPGEPKRLLDAQGKFKRYILLIRTLTTIFIDIFNCCAHIRTRM